jgi:hypothetical protein
MPMTDQILLGIIDEHLPYEIDMLRGLFRQLFGEVEPSEPDQRIQHFAQIESFCIHARSLLFFFSNKKIRSKDCDDAIASEFTTEGYTPSRDPHKGCLNVILIKLNKQIFHLTKNRKIVPDEKFNLNKDGTFVLQTIEPAIVRFTKNLKVEFEHFKCCSIPVDLIPSLGKANTTGSIYKT